LISNVLDHWFYECPNIPPKKHHAKKVPFLKIFFAALRGKPGEKLRKKGLPNQRALVVGKPTIAPSHFVEVWVYQAKE